MMANELTSAIEPIQPRFQFRLRSIFILMMITAFSFGVVPVWYQHVIIPAHLSSQAKQISPDDPGGFRIRETEFAKRYTLGFCFIGFAGSCGLWYAFASRGKQSCDIWLGLAFGLTIGFVVFPKVWAWPYTINPRSTLELQYAAEFSRLPTVFILAFFYSFWPVFLRRNAAALLLFIYMCVYGLIVLPYTNKIIIDRLI